MTPLPISAYVSLTTFRRTGVRSARRSGPPPTATTSSSGRAPTGKVKRLRHTTG